MANVFHNQVHETFKLDQIVEQIEQIESSNPRLPRYYLTHSTTLEAPHARTQDDSRANRACSLPNPPLLECDLSTTPL